MKTERGCHLSFLDATDIYKVPVGSHSSLAIHLNQPLCERKSLQQGHIFHPFTQPDLFMSLSCLISISPSFQQQVLSRHNMLCVGLPPKKISWYLCPKKDDPSIYCILCECGQFFAGSIGWNYCAVVPVVKQSIKSYRTANRDTWIGTSRMQLRLSSIPTMWRGRVALSWAGNENLIHTKKD